MSVEKKPTVGLSRIKKVAKVLFFALFAFLLISTIHRLPIFSDSPTIVVVNTQKWAFDEQVSLLETFGVTPDFDASNESVSRKLYNGGAFIVNCDPKAVATGGTPMLPSSQPEQDSLKATKFLVDKGYVVTPLIVPEGDKTIYVIFGQKQGQTISLGFRPYITDLPIPGALALGKIIWHRIWA